jgi:hypothetical protein
MRAFAALAIAFASVASIAAAAVPPGFHMFQTPLPAGERPEFLQSSIIVGDVRNAFDSEDFATIDKMAKTFIDQHAKTAAGTWNIGHLYDAFQISDTTNEYPNIHDEQLIQQWIKEFPRSPTANVAYAENIINHGFFFLKDPYHPTPEQQATFDRYVERASKVLVACRSICDQDPEWYMRMVQVAKIQDWKEKDFRQLYDEATAKFPDYQRIYFQAAEFYSPMHRRSYDDLDQFVQDAIGKTHKTEGTIFYARIYSDMAHQFAYDCHCLHLSWPRMYNAFMELNNRYRDLRNAHDFAWNACMFGDKITMKMLIPELQTPIPMDIWKSQAVFDRCKNWATDSNSPQDSPFLPRPQPPPAGTFSL